MAVCEHYANNVEGSRQRYEQLSAYVDQFPIIDRAQYYRFQISQLTFTDDKQAEEYGRVALALFGWTLPAKVTKLSLMKEIMLTQRELRQMNHEKYSIKRNDDPEFAEFCKMIIVVLFPLMTTNPPMILWMLAKFIRHGLNQGINGLLLCIIGGYEIMIQRGIPGLNNIFPTRALEALQNTSYTLIPSEQYQIPYVVALYKQLDDNAETSIYLQKAMRRGLSHGDSVFTSLALTTYIITYNGRIHVLEDLLLSMENDERFVVDVAMKERMQSVKLYCLAMRDTEAMSLFIQTPSDAALVTEDNYFCITKLEVAYLAGNYLEALFWAKEGKSKEIAVDWVQNRKLRFYQALTFAALHEKSLSAFERKEIKKVLKKRISQFGMWGGPFGAGTSAHLLLQGEYARMTGKEKEAISKLELAIRQAKDEDHGLIEGICHERLADLYEHIGSTGGATVSLLDACAAYAD